MPQLIREERPDDANAVDRINELAFQGRVEADLVSSLRSNCPDLLSLVAEEDGTVVGHILFSPVALVAHDSRHAGMGLAPMSVLPELQRTGIGSRLVQAGLDILRTRGVPFSVVLGHPDYYPRFGFQSTARFGIRSEFRGIPDDVFMILPLNPDTELDPGVIKYRPEFDAFK